MRISDAVGFDGCHTALYTERNFGGVPSAKADRICGWVFVVKAEVHHRPDFGTGFSRISQSNLKTQFRPVGAVNPPPTKGAT